MPAKHLPRVPAPPRMSLATERRIWALWRDAYPDTHFSVHEAARLTGLNSGTIRNRIADHTLPAATDDRGRLVIRAGDIRQLFRLHRTAGENRPSEPTQA